MFPAFSDNSAKISLDNSKNIDIGWTRWTVEWSLVMLWLTEEFWYLECLFVVFQMKHYLNAILNYHVMHFFKRHSTKRFSIPVVWYVAQSDIRTKEKGSQFLLHSKVSKFNKVCLKAFPLLNVMISVFLNLNLTVEEKKHKILC